MKFLLFSLLSFCWAFAPSLAFAAPSSQTRCPICNMVVKVESPTRFSAIDKDSKKTHEFCSLSCSLKYHRKFQPEIVQAQDFNTRRSIDAKSAFFIVESKAILKELEFDMPPSVIAFAKKADAEAKLKQLKDGTLVEGYSRLVKWYE